MSLSLKRLALSLTLLAIGGGAGLLGRYFPAEKGRFEQLTTVPVAVPPVSGRPFPSGETGGTTGATTAISLRQRWKSRTGGGAN